MDDNVEDADHVSFTRHNIPQYEPHVTSISRVSLAASALQAKRIATLCQNGVGKEYMSTRYNPYFFAAYPAVSHFDNDEQCMTMDSLNSFHTRAKHVNIYGNTPLHDLVRFTPRNRPCAQVLMQVGVNPNADSKLLAPIGCTYISGYTPLHLACFYNAEGMVKEILRFSPSRSCVNTNANVEVMHNTSGRTEHFNALHMAVAHALDPNKHLSEVQSAVNIVQELRDHGAHKDSATNSHMYFSIPRGSVPHGIPRESPIVDKIDKASFYQYEPNITPQEMVSQAIKNKSYGQEHRKLLCELHEMLS